MFTLQETILEDDMKLSKGFWQTYKEVPADAEIPSHQLMLRAGLIHKSGAGLYNYLPVGYRSIRKVEQIVREELDKAGCYELLMSVVTPGELWKESGRWDKMGDLMLKFTDKGNRDLCISPTNEEAVADIFRKTVKSYKQMPLTLYQINTKFRDEIRPRFGLMRGREFTMKDAYSFHMDKPCLDKVYDDLFKAYEAIFNRMKLEFSPVVADGGAMADGNAKTHEFQVIAETGEDEIIYCSETGYAANIERAETKRQSLSFDLKGGSLEEVETKGKQTIEEVCEFLGQPQHHSLKSLVYIATTGDKDEVILVQLLGDDSLNEIKLTNHLACDHLKPATDNDLENANFVKGYIGPDNKRKVRTLFDNNINLDAFYTVGANKEDYHCKGFNPKRDFGKDIEAVDLRLAKEGDLTIDGRGSVQVKRGIEVGHIFQLGDKYTKALGVTVLDQNGKAVTPLMGCYGIGISRVVAAAIEQNHDENGIIWPAAIAPYHVHFVEICKSDEMKARADEIYDQLLNAGLETIYDDRKAGPGFKFKDADLLGIPFQLVLGERDFKEDGLLEIRVRKSGEKFKVKPEEAIVKLHEMLKAEL